MARPPSNTEERWLLFGALGPLLLAILLQTALTGLTERALVKQSLQTEAETLARLSARLAAAAIEFDDFRSVEELLEHASNTPNFSFGLVVRPDGSVVAYRGAADQRERHLREFGSAPLGEPVTNTNELSFVAAVGPAPSTRLIIGLHTTAADVALLRHLLQSVLLSAVALLVGAFVVLRLVGVVARRREKLERHREVLRETGGLARVGGWELKLPGRHLELSDEAAKLLGGFDAAALLGPVMLKHPALIRCIEQGGAFDVEAEVTGFERWVRVQGQSELGEGQIVRVFGALQDITEQRATREQALAASWAKTQFLANTSHELRTPLNGIMGMAELTLGTPLNAEQQEYLHGVLQSGKTMLALVNDLLDVARIESGMMTLEHVPLSLEDVLSTATRAFATRATASGIELVLTIAPDVDVSRMGDPLRLNQVVTNLLGNALKFTERGEVEVKLSRGDGDLVVVSVRDTGIGIPGDRLEAIFGAFTQADGSTTRRYGGSGLGLTITRELTVMMGGDVTVSSTPGIGSTFSVTLPMQRAAASDLATTPDATPGHHVARGGAEPRQVASVEAPRRAPRGALRVLLAEDNPINATVARRLIERAGHAVTLAHDGQEAVDAALRDEFDLILMDLQMPRLDGLAATRLIRASSKHSNVPIVALTANAMGSDQLACTAAGMDGFLSKPIEPKALARVLDGVGRALTAA